MCQLEMCDNGRKISRVVFGGEDPLTSGMGGGAAQRITLSRDGADVWPMPGDDAESRSADTLLTKEDALRIVAEGARRYFESRRARVDEFVDRHFSLSGSLSMHR